MGTFPWAGVGDEKDPPSHVDTRGGVEVAAFRQGGGVVDVENPLVALKHERQPHLQLWSLTSVLAAAAVVHETRVGGVRERWS